MPKKRPNVVSWHINWLTGGKGVESYQKGVVEWLRDQNFSVSLHEGPFLPHVTLCRRPFKYEEWRRAFDPLPMMIKNIQLYESLGHLQYRVIWQHSLIPPIEEIEHTADFGFMIRGESFKELFSHAQIALAFLFPPLLRYRQEGRKIEDSSDLVMDLNELISTADTKIGCPLKAVSFHGEVEEGERGIWEWEMIVDV